jgi:hypothetical protein
LPRARLFCHGIKYNYYYFGDRLTYQERESGEIGYGPHQRPPNVFVTKHLTAAEKRRLRKKCREGKL